MFDEPLSRADPDLLLRKMAGGDFPYEMLSVAPWERRDYVAHRYQQDRAFIAGDAAHECSPTGGIGMHTGIEEIFNLAWKLEAMIDGWGGPALLASYEIERQPIARRNVEYATRSFLALAGIPGWRGGPEPTDWGPDRTWLSVPEHLKVQYCYEQSPICVPDGSAKPQPITPHFVPSTRPGTRAPHAWLADGRSTLDLFGDGFVLLRLGPNPPDGARLIEAANTRGVPVREVVLPNQDIATLYERGLVLVRPDGHVAWRGDEVPTGAYEIIDRVRGAENSAHAGRTAERLEA